MTYQEAITTIRQYDALNAKPKGELIEAVFAAIDYITGNSEDESAEDLREWAEQVKTDLQPTN